MSDKKMNVKGREINTALGKFLNASLKQKITPSKEDDYNIMPDTDLPANLRMMFQELATSFIKLGQLLRTRPDMVGDRITTEFEKLQDDNLPISFDEVKRRRFLHFSLFF